MQHNFSNSNDYRLSRAGLGLYTESILRSARFSMGIFTWAQDVKGVLLQRLVDAGRRGCRWQVYASVPAGLSISPFHSHLPRGFHRGGVSPWRHRGNPTGQFNPSRALTGNTKCWPNSGLMLGPTLNHHKIIISDSHCVECINAWTLISGSVNHWGQRLSQHWLNIGTTLQASNVHEDNAGPINPDEIASGICFFHNIRSMILQNLVTTPTCH